MLKIETVLEEALHHEAVTGIGEEERELKVAIRQPDNTERLIYSVNNFVKILRFSREWRSDNRGSFRE